MNRVSWIWLKNLYNDQKALSDKEKYPDTKHYDHANIRVCLAKSLIVKTFKITGMQQEFEEQLKRWVREYDRTS